MTKLKIPLVVQQENASQQPINIPTLEEHYGGKFIGDFCLKTKNGGWSERPIAVFYQPNPDVEAGHSHYFGLLVDNLSPDTGSLMITNAESAFSEPISGIITDEGEILFSRYRHDFRQSLNGECFIDGGRDYCRFGGGSYRIVQLLIDKDKLVVDPKTINSFWFDEKPKTTLSED